MNVDLAFGRHGLRLELSEDPAPHGARWNLLEPRWATPLDDPRAAIERALDQPLAGPPLEELARGRSSAAISVCDITRPAPNQLTLPPLVERLQRAGITRENIT